LHARLVRNVALDEATGRSFRLAFGEGIAALFLMNIGKNRRVTLARKGVRSCPSDPGTRTGDERNSSFSDRHG
jgi:hypothetical protein